MKRTLLSIAILGFTLTLSAVAAGAPAGSLLAGASVESPLNLASDPAADFAWNPGGIDVGIERLTTAAFPRDEQCVTSGGISVCVCSSGGSCLEAGPNIWWCGC